MLVEVKGDQLKDHCFDKENFIKAFGEYAFEEFGKDYTHENVDDFRKEIKKSSSSPFYQYTFKKLFNSKALVNVNLVSSGLADGALTVIKLLKESNVLKISPYFFGCLLNEKVIYTIQESIHSLSNSIEMVKVFSQFQPHERAFRFLQVAMAIQNLHSLGFSHQNIKPENIVSMDAQMTDVRLIDFNYAVKHGAPGRGGTLRYNSPDKLENNFLANFNHDAYAYAITMITLEDFKSELFSLRYPILRANFNEDFITEFKNALHRVRESSGLKELYDLFASRLFDQNNPLNISEVIDKLVEVYEKVAPKDESKDVKLDEQVQAFKSRSKLNSEKISKLKSANESDNGNMI